MFFFCQMGNNVMKASNGDEILQYKMSLPIVQEQEERRMSDLSDLASSVTSAADIQVMEGSYVHLSFQIHWTFVKELI